MSYSRFIRTKLWCFLTSMVIQQGEMHFVTDLVSLMQMLSAMSDSLPKSSLPELKSSDTLHVVLESTVIRKQQREHVLANLSVWVTQSSHQTGRFTQGLKPKWLILLKRSGKKWGFIWLKVYMSMHKRK